jgi:hypothetical protein
MSSKESFPSRCVQRNVHGPCGIISQFRSRSPHWSTTDGTPDGRCLCSVAETVIRYSFHAINSLSGPDSFNEASAGVCVGKCRRLCMAFECLSFEAVERRNKRRICVHSYKFAAYYHMDSRVSPRHVPALEWFNNLRAPVDSMLGISSWAAHLTISSPEQQCIIS